MTEKSISPAFSAKTGERDLEIFLLSDASRKEFRRIQEMGAAEARKQRAEQEARKDADRREAARQIRIERQKLDLKPPSHWQGRGRKESYIQREAERRVESQNRAADEALAQQQRAHEDVFLVQQREQRLSREVQERETRSRSPPDLKRDFDRAR